MFYIWLILANIKSFFFFFLAFDFCLFCVVIRFIHPRHNGQWPPTSKDFFTRFYPLHNFLILILEKEPVFPFSMLSDEQGNSWYHFITSLVWRGPWLGIEPVTSRTRSQHSTTRVSRRRWIKSLEIVTQMEWPWVKDTVLFNTTCSHTQHVSSG